jgi:Heparinase II/III-like protein
MDRRSNREVIMGKRWLLIAACMLALPFHLWSEQSPSQPLEKWSMQDSFANGIPSWQSYPLAQDIGYDPSVYTTTTAGKPVLVRDVVNEGQQSQSIGVIRPLKFRLTASTQIALTYSLRLAGRPVAAKLILAAEDGARFEAPLPLDSDLVHPRTVTGTTLLAHSSPANIVGVVIDRSAPVGAHSVLTIAAFSVTAMRPAAMVIQTPRLLISSDESTPVAEGSVTRGQSARFAFTSQPERVVVSDGAGTVVPSAATIDGSEVRFAPDTSASPGLWTVEASDHRASLAFKVLVLPAPTGQGVVFSSQRLNQLRTESRYAALREAIHREARRQAEPLRFNAQAGDSITLLPSESVHAGLLAYIGLMTNYGAAIAYGALDYRLNGDQKSLETARKALATVAAWKTWTPTWFTSHGMHTYYVVGVFTEQTAFGYDLVSDQLSTAERAAVENALINKSIQPTIDDYFLRQRMPTSASNHMAHSVGGAIAAWAACDRANPHWRSEHSTALAELLTAYEGLLGGLFPGDGSEREPAGYEIFAMEGMTYGIAGLQNLGIMPKGASAMMDSFWWLRYAEINPQLLLDTGDTSGSLPGLYGYAWVAEHSKDPGARWLYDTVVRPAMESPHAEAKREEAPPNLLAISRAPNILDLLCCTEAAAPAPPTPSSRIFPSRGSAVLREGWKENQTVISLRAGPWMNHEHHDQGSFQLASRGELLVGEGGYADYYRDPNYKDYFSEAAAHNVVLLDADGFSQVPYDGVYYKALANYPHITFSLLTNQIDYVETDLQPAYGDALKRYRRTMLFVKPDLLVVSDDLEARTPHAFRWLLHPAAGASTSQQGQAITIDGKTHRAAVTAVPSNDSLHWQVGPAPVPINDFTDLDRVPVLDRHVLSLTSPSSLGTRFLVGLSVATTKQEATIEKQATAAGEGFLQKRSDQQTTVLYRKSAGPLVAPGAATDGDILVVIRAASSDGEHVFASHASYLRTDELPALSWNTPANVVLDRGHGEVVLSFDLDRPCTLHFDGSWEDNTVALDGKPASGFAASHALSLEPGKHQVRYKIKF